MTRERLYQLLPAAYRVRDAAEGEPLRALLGAIEAQLEALEGDIAGLYDNWFIETCSEWAAPYIGDLLGVRALDTGAGQSARPYVANTLAYRRRKGTPAVLEQLARDVTGWQAKAVEYFQLLETTQHLKHVRLANVRTPDLRDSNALELLGGAFESAAHTADVRRITFGNPGKYNIPNVGLVVWRLENYPISRGSARAIATPPDPAPPWRFTFNPLGFDAPLFNRPQTGVAIAEAVKEIHVPARLRRRPLYNELEAARQALVDVQTPVRTYFGPEPVLEVFLSNSETAVPSEQVIICNLDEWRRPPATKNYRPSAGGPHQARPIQAAVDPVLGRIAFPAGVEPASVEVGYSYGFSADLGGGPYNRSQSAAQGLSRPVTWQIAVSKQVAPVAGVVVATLGEAVQQWNARPAGSVGVIAILDSRSYEENLVGASRVQIPESSQLLIVAADWPLVAGPEPLAPRTRVIGQFTAEGRRPHLRGDVSVVGTAGAASGNPGTLAIDGLVLEGGVRVLVGNLGSLRIAHSTIVPGAGSLSVNPSAGGLQNSRLSITLDHCICGAISLTESVPRLAILDSIVDAATVTAPGAAAVVERSTLLGVLSARSLDAGSSIFTDRLRILRRQEGCVRFSFVPSQSVTPRCYRCQPALALQGKTTAAATAILARLRPTFTARRFGEPGYVQLSPACPEEIHAGGEDGSEMGAFHALRQPQREANLHTTLEEYLRFGLEAGVFHAT